MTEPSITQINAEPYIRRAQVILDRIHKHGDPGSEWADVAVRVARANIEFAHLVLGQQLTLKAVPPPPDLGAPLPDPVVETNG